jgi:hypothetical protein
MPVKIPQSLKTMLEDKAYGHVVTFNVKGNPELTMVWMDIDGDELLFNTAEGRRKPDNIRRDRVSLSRSRTVITRRRTRSSTAKGASPPLVPTRTSTSWRNGFLG